MKRRTCLWVGATALGALALGLAHGPRGRPEDVPGESLCARLGSGHFPLGSWNPSTGAT